MTEQEELFITEGLSVMEEALFTLEGEERRQVEGLMQQLSALTSPVADGAR